MVFGHTLEVGDLFLAAGFIAGHHILKAHLALGCLGLGLPDAGLLLALLARLVRARAAIAAMERHGAERLVAEVNQGGDLVESVIRQVDPLVPFRALRAARGKGLRAEPVAALYEQGRIRHLRGLGALEDQMCRMTLQGYDGKGSPDRLDALVWAVHELMIEPASHYRRPQVRGL